MVCMRTLVRLLVLNPQIFSLNLGERKGFYLTMADYRIVARAVETGCTGLALCWLEHEPERLWAAVNANRRRLQDKARSIFAVTGHAATAWACIPWRDPVYRDRLMAAHPGKSEYTALGQHHVRGLDRWGDRELKM